MVGLGLGCACSAVSVYVKLPHQAHPLLSDGLADHPVQCLFVSFGFLNACGIFQLYYEEELLRNKDSSDITWITTIALFLMYFTGPALGVLGDKKGPKIVLIPSGFLIVFAICMLSLSTQYYQIMLAEGVAFGLGAGGMFLTPMLCVGKWFSSKRGLATGIVVSGSGLGKTLANHSGSATYN